jgi:hypothetical protein
MLASVSIEEEVARHNYQAKAGNQPHNPRVSLLVQQNPAEETREQEKEEESHGYAPGIRARIQRGVLMVTWLSTTPSILWLRTSSSACFTLCTGVIP